MGASSTNTNGLKGPAAAFASLPRFLIDKKKARQGIEQDIAEGNLQSYDRGLGTVVTPEGRTRSTTRSRMAFMNVQQYLRSFK